jgi:NADH:ubiquinone oxidoreductase subunit 6 (subunit J)
VLLGAAIAAVVVFTAVDVEWNELTGAALEERAFIDTISTIGDQLLGQHILAFEVASILLLFALLGAIVLVTDRREVEAETDSEDVA